MALWSFKSATFTTAAAIEAFLPQVGTSASLAHDHTDPTSTEAGELAGQVVALTLNVGFDLFDPAFSASTTPLNTLVIDDEDNVCNGKTVQEVLDLANRILAGEATGFTAEDVNSCVTHINEGFLNGESVAEDIVLPECLFSSSEWSESRKALRSGDGPLHDKLMAVFDKDKDGKLKGSEKRQLAKAYRDHKIKDRKKRR